jgi:anti-sigma factor RsiW
MIHLRARPLLPSLVEGDLPAGVGAGGGGHVQGCARCRRILAELRRSVALLRRLPASLLPLEASEEADTRLTALARWAVDPAPVWREHFGASAIGAFALAACLVVVAVTSSWAPVLSDPAKSVTLAAVMPEAQNMAPLGWR